MKIVNTHIFSTGNPQESFLCVGNVPMVMTIPEASHVADALNQNKTGQATRYWKVVPDFYELVTEEDT